MPLKKNVECPVLCVTSHDLCPQALAPNCPAGQTFCLDGTCQESCGADITNACLCNGEAIGAAYTNYVPCMAGQLVNITDYSAEKELEETRSTCASSAGLSSANASTIGIWGVDTTNPMIWAECPELPLPTFTFTEPMWIAVWALAGAQAGLLILWHLYKTGREFAFHKSMQTAAATGVLRADKLPIDEKVNPSSLASDDDKEEVTGEGKTTNDEKNNTAPGAAVGRSTDSETSSLQDSERLRFRGFNIDYIGLFVFGSVVCTTLLFLVFLGCIVNDYCKFFFYISIFFFLFKFYFVSVTLDLFAITS